MRTRTRVAVAAVVLLAAAIGAGLAFLVQSEERLSKPAYEHTVRSAYAPIQQAFARTAGASAVQLPARLLVAGTRLRDAAELLEANNPPRSVEHEHEELVEGLRAFAVQLDGLRSSVAAGDGLAVRRFNAGIAQNKVVEQIAEAAEEMKFKGYDLGRIAEE